MIKYEGKSVYDSIAIGKIRIFKKLDLTVKKYSIGDITSELKRFEAAREKAQAQLKELHAKTAEQADEESAAIFDVHIMMLDDPDFVGFIRTMIGSEKINSEFAVFAARENFSNVFSHMEDEYMKERAADIKDISERLIRILNNTGTEFILNEPAIIIAEDLTPSETVQLDKDKILAFVTRFGSTNSHTAILARMMSIPALVSTDIIISDDLNNKMAVVDGNSGTFLIEPEQAELKKYEKILKVKQKNKRFLQNLKGKENVTLDGTGINIYANIGNLSDIANALENDAGGIGLFRSEFLYLEKDTYPTEEEQFLAYKQAAETMKGKKTIIRTLDIGADKQAEYFNLEKEENPAMGYRAIRICLDRTGLFKTQLRAVYRASAYGNIAVMYPMIISVEEVKRIKEITDEVKAELSNENIIFGKVEQGIMIETPAAVMISDLLAREVDFFSIGTNDLTQYTLAVDRQNQKLDDLFNPRHEAILRMIRLVVENGHKAGIWVGICGELGADTSLTEQFLKIGVDEVSVAPSFILSIRDKVRKLDLK